VVLVDVALLQHLSYCLMLEESNGQELGHVLKVLRSLVEWHDSLWRAGSVSTDSHDQE
jgi:hypothetical protein